MILSRHNRIMIITLLIAVLGIAGSGAVIYRTISETITSMAMDEMAHLLTATSNLLQQSTDQAIINHLRSIASAHLGMVQQIYREYQTGAISEAEAKQRATRILLNQKIGLTGYMYCLDSKGYLRVHPYPQLVNFNMNRFQLAHDQVRLKNGYLEYFWKNPGEALARPKALYMCYFAPWDWIISASSYRSEFNSLTHPDDFKKDVLSIRLGQTGYLYILDGFGNVVIHPKYPAGQNVADMRDARGRFFVREMLKNKSGKIRYWWKNPGEAAAREKVVMYRYYPALNWIILGGVYLEELYLPLRHIRNLMSGTLALNCLFALIMLLLFRRSVMSMQKAEEKAVVSSLATMEKIIDSLPVALIVVNQAQRIQRVNEAACHILDAKAEALVGQPFSRYLPDCARDSQRHVLKEIVIEKSEGRHSTVLLSEIPVALGDERIDIAIFMDISERKQMETQLRHAQKLESVGQLAAGIAHEINTPVQYVGDNLQFLSDAFKTLLGVVEQYQRLVRRLATMPGGDEYGDEIQALEAEADLEYLQENTPPAFQGAVEGVSRIATIVRAMKEFAHPDEREKTEVDINRALQATLTIARNEYKYIAEVETALGDIPPVLCHAGDINQVFLNLIINASQAMAEVVEKNGGKGLLKVSTALDGPYVRIEIEDTGAGIPDAIRYRVFDPFFTTKAVGKGTGQGLAIARSIVVDKHHGRLTFTSQVGRGTIFFIMLPIGAKPSIPLESETAAAKA
jgi:PAS domain S-box-containing protein